MEWCLDALPTAVAEAGERPSGDAAAISRGAACSAVVVPWAAEKEVMTNARPSGDERGVGGDRMAEASAASATPAATPSVGGLRSAC